jgi:hypothetical protein
MHTAEALVPEPNFFAEEIAIEKLKSYKSPGIDQVAELITFTNNVQNLIQSPFSRLIPCVDEITGNY